MIVWLASYPRSGNTFLRLVLHALYGVPTYSVYDDNDPVAQRVGPALVGYRPKPTDRTLMVESEDIFFVKTHKRRKTDRHPAIYLVRDGRDAVVSHARLRASMEQSNEDKQAKFESLLREEITRPCVDGQPSSGTWGAHVLSWLDTSSAPIAVLKYEDLITRPNAAVACVLSSLLPDLVPVADGRIPSFDELHRIDSGFFRRGEARSNRDEMSDELHKLFWVQPENATAMRRMGYAK